MKFKLYQLIFFILINVFATAQIITIPADNYNGITFASAMQAALNNLASLMQNIAMNLIMQFTVTYDYTHIFYILLQQIIEEVL